MGKKTAKTEPVLRVAAVILGAGSATRMGECKVLLPLGGKTALARAVERLKQGGIQDIWVVTGAREAMVSAEARRLGCSVVHNPNYVEGIHSSIRAGIGACLGLADAILFLPGDLPLVKPATIRDLIRSFPKNKKLLYPTFLKEQGYPLLVGSALFASVQNQSKPAELEGLVAKYENRALAVPVADRCVLLDMDTREDYLGLCEYLKWEYIPDRQECAALLELAQTPQSVVRHGRVVAQVALTLALELQQKGKEINLHLLRAACLLHDIAKAHANHELLGARWLRKRGFEHVASLVAVHKDLSPSKALGEAELLYLADKMVSGERLFSLEERLLRLKERPNEGNTNRENTRRRLERAKELQKKIEKISGKSLTEMLSGKTRPPGIWLWLPRNDWVIPAHF